MTKKCVTEIVFLFVENINETIIGTIQIMQFHIFGIPKIQTFFWHYRKYRIIVELWGFFWKKKMLISNSYGVKKNEAVLSSYVWKWFLNTRTIHSVGSSDFFSEVRLLYARNERNKKRKKPRKIWTYGLISDTLQAWKKKW